MSWELYSNEGKIPELVIKPPEQKSSS